MISKKRLMVRSFLMIVIAALAISPFTASSNHVFAASTIVNPGFDAEGATQTPSGWTEMGDAAASYTQSGGRSGNKLSHWSSTDYEVSTYQYLTGIANGTYTISAWVQSSGGQIYNTFEASDFGGAKLFTNIPATGTWVQIFVRGIEVTNGQIKIGFYSKAHATNWSNFDDVVITKETDAAVINAGFDSSGATQTPTGWTEWGDINASFTESGGHTGGYHLSQWSANPYEVTTYQTVSGLTNGTYSLSAWVKSSGGQNAAYLEADHYGGSAIRTSIPTRNTWTRIFIRGITVSNGQLQIAIYSNANAGNWINVDEIKFTKDNISYNFIKGVDPSYLEEKEPIGVLFRDSSGIAKDAMQIYSENGVNYARIRVWNNSTLYGKTQTLALAKRANSKGMKILIDFHYSATWASNHQQTKPAEWASLSFPNLKTAMYNYTKDVVQSLVNQGTPPSIVQIGNESDHGILWNDGKVNKDGVNNWDNYADLLKTGFQAVKDVSPSIQTMIHSEDGSSTTRIHEHLDPLWARGVRPDILGFSYYTSWNANNLDGLTTALTDAISSYGLPVLVEETAYPFYPYVSGVNDYIYKSVKDSYSQTAAGQKDYMLDIMSRVKALPGGKGLGVIYWGSDGIEPSGQWNNGALFDFGNNNKALPALSVFRNN